VLRVQSVSLLCAIARHEALARVSGPHALTIDDASGTARPGPR
jgi:hypothetical protein